MQRSVRDTTHAEVQYDVAIVLSGSPEERLRPAADLLLSGRVRFLLYSGAHSAYESRVVTSTLRSRHIRDDEILFERASRNTHENAVESARIVTEHGWKRVVLVTGAIHARRALACFHKAGLFPDLLPVLQKRPRGVLPQWWALDVSTAVVHEMVGLIAYRVAGYAH
ncbi:MAG: YdcF family protein [Myxococcales bacterium]